MHYPALQDMHIDNLNKIGFASLASAAIMNLMKRQRDSVGMSIYSDRYEFYSNEKASERHHQMLLQQLNKALGSKSSGVQTNTYEHLHLIAEKLKRRSLVFLFTDMFQSDKQQHELFEALQHLKYNKHEVVLFHTYDKEKELRFDFNNRPKKFVDTETSEHINLYPDNVKENYETAVQSYFDTLALKCGNYRIKYVPVDVNDSFNTILTTYLVERARFG